MTAAAAACREIGAIILQLPLLLSVQCAPIFVPFSSSARIGIGLNRRVRQRAIGAIILLLLLQVHLPSLCSYVSCPPLFYRIAIHCVTVYNMYTGHRVM